MSAEDELDQRFEQYRQTGSHETRNQLVEEHLRLARALARRYRHRGIPLDDLEQVARMGLIGAVNRFDPAHGVRFATFASRTIDGELKRYFRDRAWSVRVPRRQQNLALAARSQRDELAKQLGRTPSVQELAAAMGVEIDECLLALEASRSFQAESIDVPVAGGDGTSVADQLSTYDSGPDRIDDRALVADLLSRLPDRERTILELRFFNELSQREIAERVGVSQMHVSRLLRRALAALAATTPRQ